MRIKTKKIIMVALMAVLSLSLVLSGCAPKETTPSTSTNPGASTSQSQGGSEKKNFALGANIKAFANVYCVEAIEGIKKGLADYNAEHGENHTITWTDGQNDQQREINNMEDLVNQNVDGVIMLGRDPVSSENAMMIPINKGIPLVIIDSYINNYEKADAVILSDNKAIGALQMEKLAEACGGKGNLVIFIDSTNANSKLRSDGMYEVLKKYPDIKLVHMEDGISGVDGGLNAFQNIMQMYQEIDMVWSMSDSLSQGIISAITGSELEGKCVVSGVNGSRVACELIKKGEQYGSAAQFPFKMGEEGVKLLIEILKGNKPADDKKITMLQGEWIDKSNVDKFLDEVYGYEPTVSTK